MSAPRLLVIKLSSILSRSLLTVLMLWLWALCSIFSLVMLASILDLSWIWVAAGGKGEINVVASLGFVGLVLWGNRWVVFKLPNKVLTAFKSRKAIAPKARSLMSKLYGIVARPLLRSLLLLLWALSSILSLIVLDSTFNLSWIWPAAEGKSASYIIADLALVGIIVWVNWWVVFRLPCNLSRAVKGLVAFVENEPQTNETSSQEKPDYAGIIRISISLDNGGVFKQKNVKSLKSND